MDKENNKLNQDLEQFLPMQNFKIEDFYKEPSEDNENLKKEYSLEDFLKLQLNDDYIKNQLSKNEKLKKKDVLYK
tara:strand:- start:32 stop:256 length:225 start_codon:yes stop_codon:yes gene_type:complete